MIDQSSPGAEVATRKATLRRRLLATRAARPVADRVTAGEHLAAVAAALPAVASARTVTAYVGVGAEPPTLPLLDLLRSRGVTVLLPVLAPARTLDWATYTGPDDLAEAVLGLLQPTGERHGPDAHRTADVLLVPALAVDRAGHRIGHGAGYYDRALARAPKVPAWALVYDDEVLPDVPVTDHDRPVHGVITPSGATALPAQRADPATH